MMGSRSLGEYNFLNHVNFSDVFTYLKSIGINERGDRFSDIRFSASERTKEYIKANADPVDYIEPKYGGEYTTFYGYKMIPIDYGDFDSDKDFGKLFIYETWER